MPAAGCDLCAYAAVHGWWGPDHKGTHCGDCHASWSGTGKAHCTVCHQTFASNPTADLHWHRECRRPSPVWTGSVRSGVVSVGSPAVSAAAVLLLQATSAGVDQARESRTAVTRRTEQHVGHDIADRQQQSEQYPEQQHLGTSCRQDLASLPMVPAYARPPAAHESTPDPFAPGPRNAGSSGRRMVRRMGGDQRQPGRSCGGPAGKAAFQGGGCRGDLPWTPSPNYWERAA